MEWINFVAKVMSVVWPAFIFLVVLFLVFRYADYITRHFSDSASSRRAFALLTGIILVLLAVQEILFRTGRLTEINKMSPATLNQFIQFTIICAPFGIVNFFLGIFSTLRLNRKINLILSMLISLYVVGQIFQRYFPIAAG